MEWLQTIYTALDRLIGWQKSRTNPVRKQAARVLQAFAAHGIAYTQINRYLPAELQLTQFELSTADELKKALKRQHIDWLASFLALNPDWLDGLGEQAHTVIDSYKRPQLLHEWFQQHRAQAGEGLHYKLHFITDSCAAITPASSGYFALVLEVFFEANGSDLSRYYHLTDGAHFDHPPCVLHLMQVLALSHVHGAIMRRVTLSTKDLHALSCCQGLIPEWLGKTKPHPLEADHEFWGHFSGHAPNWVALRNEAEQSLEREGLHEVVAHIQRDRKRFARP